jgi:hypothetical protein
MPPRKQPQDRRAKTRPAAEGNGTEPEAEEADEYFTFTDRHGNEHTAPRKTLDILTPGFIRRNRKLEETDFVFTAIEELCGDTKEGAAILEVIDHMERQEFLDFQDAFVKHLGATMGE